MGFRGAAAVDAARIYELDNSNVSINNDATEQIVYTSFPDFPADFFPVGTSIRHEMLAMVQNNTGLGTPDLTVRAYYERADGTGDTLLGSALLQDFPASVAQRLCVVRFAGKSGRWMLDANYYANDGAIANDRQGGSWMSVTPSLAVPWHFYITVQWSVADVNLFFIRNICRTELLKP